jgi:Beta-lactamase enzyme family
VAIGDRRRLDSHERASRSRGPSLAAAALVLAVALTVGTGFASVGPAAKPRLAWRAHFGLANRYLRHRAGEISYGVVGPNGYYHGHHGARTAPMASTFKVMLLATYLRRPAVRHRPIRHADRSLLGPMIRRSDNLAATRVRDIVGRGAIEHLAHDAHMRDFHYDAIWGLSRTSARDQARFMYRFERYVPKRHRQYARHLLTRIVPSQRWGIGRVALHGWRLHFKGGWGSGTGAVDHQVAFLQSHGYRISVAILTTSNPSHAYGKVTLTGVARRLLWGLPRL